jgi:hypothetical protein
MLNQIIVKSMQNKAILLLNVLLKYLKMLITCMFVDEFAKSIQWEVIKPIDQVKDKTIYKLTTNIFYIKM